MSSRSRGQRILLRANQLGVLEAVVSLSPCVNVDAPLSHGAPTDIRSPLVPSRSPAGHHCPPATARPIPCPSGEYQPVPGKGECRACGYGLDSELGSTECTFCAAHFFRPHASSPARECASCNTTLTGVACSSNTTTESLILNHGRWRHSAATLA